MNEIVKSEEQELTPAIIKKYICPQANEQEVYMFLQLCRSQNLNPFLREAYLIKYGTEKATIVVGKETFTKRADMLPMNDGFSAGIILLANDKQVVYREGSLLVTGEELLGGWAIAYRKDRTHPVRIEVSMTEYVRHNSKGETTKAWREMPATMIRKVALVQALREAYPSEFGGMYTPEEMPIDSSNLPEYKVGQSISPPISPQRKSETTTTPKEENPFASETETVAGLTVVEVTEKHGEKKGKKWTKHSIVTSDGVIYSTFSDTLAGRAKEANAAGNMVSVVGEESDYGWELKDLTIISPEPNNAATTSTAESGWTIEKIIDIITSSDDVGILEANWKSLIPQIGKLDAKGKVEAQKVHDETKKFLTEGAGVK